MSEPSALDSVAKRKTTAPAASASASTGTSALDGVAKRKQSGAAPATVAAAPAAEPAATSVLSRIQALLTDPARLKDVAIGAGKATVQDATGIASMLSDAANPIQAAVNMLRGSSPLQDAANLVSPGASDRLDEDLASTNTDQTVGKVAQFVATVGVPAFKAGGQAGARFVASRRAAAKAAPAAEDAAAGLAKRTGTSWSPNAPFEKTAPIPPMTMPVPARPPRPAVFSQTGTGAVPVPPVEGPLPPFTPPTLPVTVPPASPAAALSKTSGTAMTAAPMPQEPLSWVVNVPSKAQTAPVVQRATEALKAAAAPAAADAAPGVAGAAPAAPADPLKAFAAMMADKGAKVDAVLTTTANEAGPAAAADAFEETIRGELARIVKDARRRLGGDRAGDLLYGNSKRKGLLGLPEGTVPRPARRASIDALDPSPSRTPQIVEEARAAKAAKASKEGGFSLLMPTATIAGAGVGAAIGGTQGETREDRLTNAALGGSLGAITVPLITHAALTRSPKKLQGYLYSSVLSSPQSLVKAYMGAVGGTIDAAVEKMAAGDVQAGTRILGALFHEQSVRTFLQALKQPSTASLSGIAADAPTVLGRVFGAGDAVAKRAMAAGGIGPEEAARYTLSGTPTSPMGKDVLGLYGKWFPLRLVSTMFPRVGIQILERGLERLPIGATAARKLGVGAGTTKAMRARQVLGTVAGLGAYAGNDQVPDWAKPYLVAMAGVYSLPVGLGVGIAEAQSQGKGLRGSLKAVANTFAQNLPFPQYGPSQVLDPENIASMAVPNILRDVARARDPHERETAGQFLGRMRAKIPGLRETLPVQGQPVNIAGQPNQDRSSAATRFFTPAPFQSTKMQDIPKPVADELTRLNVTVNVPSLRLEGKVGKFDLKTLPVDAAVLERARLTRRQFLVPQIQKLLASASYQRADDTVKRRRLAAIVERAQQAGSAKARTEVVQALRKQGALR